MSMKLSKAEPMARLFLAAVLAAGLSSGVHAQDQADMDLLEYVAEETGGQHYNTVDPEDLSAIFNSIADHIFLRLIE